MVCFHGVYVKSNAEETSYIKSTEVYKRIKSEIEKIRIIDNHEHLPPENQRLKEEAPDFFDIVLRSYAGADISNIGNAFPYDKRYLDKSLNIEERWKSFLPIYERMRNTGYMRCVRIGIKKVHDIEISDASSIREINDSLKKLYKPGIYKKIIYDQGKIDCVLNYFAYKKFNKDDYPDFFRVVRYLDNEIIFTKPEDIYDLEKRYNVLVHSLDDLEKVYRKFIDESIRDGVVGFKSAAAYLRTINYTTYTREKAESLLKKLLTFTKARWKQGEALTVSEGRELTNYCMHLMLKIIEEKGYPISFHTGLQTIGQNDIRWSNPQHLIPLFREYKNLNFDIFHGGFPYVTEFIELGKSWRNVFLNLCWNHIITPEGARTQLSELLECVPVNKIFAFGSDTKYPELVIGHLEMAKENCALVLAEKVLNGFFSYDEAVDFARRILRTNLIEFYKLKLPEK